MKFLSFSQTKLGSSLSLPARGWVGARATLLAAHFAKQNTNSVGVQSEGEAEGGCGGIRQLANRLLRKRSPSGPARSEQNPAKKFSFPFRRKNRARAKERQRKLFCGMASVSERRRGGASKFAIRIFVKKSSDFNQKVPQ